MYIELIFNIDLHSKQGHIFFHVIYSFLFPGDGLLSRPIFTQEPHDVIFPLDLSKSEVVLNCAANGYPSPRYR